MATVLVNQIFSDIDELGHAVGWSLDFKQLEKGQFHGAATVFAGARSALMDVRLGSVFHQRGGAVPGTLTFGIHSAGLSRWCGVELSGDELLSFDHPQGFDGVSDERHSGYTVSLSEDLLTDALRGHEPGVESLRRAGSVRSSAVAQARQELSVICATLKATPNAIAPHHLDRLMTDAIVALLEHAGPCDTPSNPVARNALRRRALELIEAQAHDAVSVTSVCGELRTSRQTLDRAFREQFGVGVKRYIMSVRLRGVRRDLMIDGSIRKVADVANRWGFWHMGQFAKDYRNTYGELPSHTIARARRPAECLAAG